MTFALPNEPKLVRYSPGEQRLFSLLSGKEVSSEDLSKRFYRGREAPYHSRRIIVSLITSLEKKVAVNKEAFTIRKSPRSGPYPIRVWIEKR